MAHLLISTAVCSALAIGCGQRRPGGPAGGNVFFTARDHQTRYAGPGRAVPEPADVQEVRIGYFGLDDANDPDSGDLWRAARMAVEQANAEGGYRGKPFRLVPRWSKGQWGTGAAEVVRLAYRDRVWAIIGGPDGASTHLAEQVAAKARLTLLSPASTDKTVNLVNVPWMFSLVPADHLLAPALAAEISARVGRRPIVLVSAADHDARLLSDELGKALRAFRLVPRRHFVWRPDATRADALAAQIVAAAPTAVVLLAGPADSAKLVVAVRRARFAGLIFGGPPMGRRRFAKEAGAAAEGVVFPLLYRRPKAKGGFAQRFRNRWRVEADYAAAHTYDAVALLVAAVRKAGLNRARIADAVRALSPWTGVTGVVRWDPSGANTRPVRLAAIRNGRPEPLAAEHPAKRPSGQPDGRARAAISRVASPPRPGRGPR